MANVQLVVLSRYPDLFSGFAANVHEHEPELAKVLIRDGIDILSPLGNWRMFQGISPFVYARNLNIGWRVTAPDDVIVCGDDVRFTTPFVEGLREAAYSTNHNVGVATVQLWGQSPFVCGYFKRSVIDAVGPMDERFIAYGQEDMDFCRRMEALGYVTLPTEAVKAEHTGGTSFGRRVKELGTTMEEFCRVNNELFKAKWRGNEG